MKVVLWIVGLFALAVGLSLFAQINTGYAIVFVPPYRVELSLEADPGLALRHWRGHVVLQLPARFPLAPVSVEGQGCAGLSEGKWRATQLSLQAQLRATTFDGNVVQAVRRWQGNALRLFEGLEACAVCYCVVHPSDRSLPRPACRTCQHRFHASCLYKWFRSSGNATCPLCRALF